MSYSWHSFTLGLLKQFVDNAYNMSIRSFCLNVCCYIIFLFFHSTFCPIWLSSFCMQAHPFLICLMGILWKFACYPNASEAHIPFKPTLSTKIYIALSSELPNLEYSPYYLSSRKRHKRKNLRHPWKTNIFFFWKKKLFSVFRHVKFSLFACCLTSIRLIINLAVQKKKKALHVF